MVMYQIKGRSQITYQLQVKLYKIVYDGICSQIMFCILPCGSIKDKVTLSPVGTCASLVPQLDATRNQIRKLTDFQYLISILQKGEVIMTKKVAFDNYLSLHVDLMKAYVSTYTPCNFIYSSYFGGPDINTTSMGPKDQWAFEIVMTRYNLSSIYHAGAYGNMRTIFQGIAASYKEGAKPSPQLIKDIQITYQYFNEGYQPLKRLLPYSDAIESLASAQVKNKYPELSKTMFEVYTNLVTCNLAYLKIQKCRLLREFRKCKEASWAVYLRILDCKAKLNSIKGQFQSITCEITDFFDLTEIFYQILAFYFMLLQHEENKSKEDYGFVKKQFQIMIHDNISAVDQIQKLMQSTSNLKRQNDNVVFGLGVLSVIIEETRKFKYRYDIAVHQNKMQRPSIKEVVGRRMGASNIWQSLDFF